jgi:hypothetical protein
VAGRSPAVGTSRPTAAVRVRFSALTTCHGLWITRHHGAFPQLYRRPNA